MNKGTITNSLIGEMEIDLEDRLMGEPKLKERFAFVIYKDFYEKEIEKIKLDYSQEAEEKKNKYKFEVTNLGQKIELFDKDLKIPVEYKDLKHPGKGSTSQGTAELFVEALPFDVSRLIPM